MAVTEAGNASAWAAIRPNALVKWGGAFLVILLQSPFYLTVPARGAGVRILGWIIGLAAIGAGSIGFYSSITGYERGIGIATLPLLVAMLVMPMFFWLGRRDA